MKPIVESITRVLRDDPLIIDLVGVDTDNEVKVYAEMAKTDVPMPYIVWFVAPGGFQQGSYGEKYSIIEVNTQVACWAETPKLAWQLADAVEEAFEEGDFGADQYEFMQVRRSGFPQPLPDRDTNNFQVAIPLIFQFSGPG